MRDSGTPSRASRYLATVAWLVIVIAGMRAAEPILGPMLLSIFIAMLASPPMFWLERKGLPIWLAGTLVLLLLSLIELAIAIFVGSSLAQFTEALPRYQQQLDNQLAMLVQLLDSRGVKLANLGLFDFVDPGAAMRMGATVLGSLGTLLSNWFLVSLTVIFMLFAASTFPHKLAAIRGDAGEPFGPFRNVVNNVYQYLAIKTVVSLMTGLAVFVWLSLLDVDFPILWGLLAFLLNYIPNLGSIIAAAPAVVLALIQFGLTQALVVALGYMAINVVFGNVLEPRLMGKSLGISTLTVFLSMVFWGWVLGPVGMILSVPLTIILMIALENSEETRWIAILLGSGPSEAAPADAKESAANGV